MGRLNFAGYLWLFYSYKFPGPISLDHIWLLGISMSIASVANLFRRLLFPPVP